MRCNIWPFLYFLLYAFLVFVFNESILFYLTIWKCEWPCGEKGCDSKDLKVFMISDTHLLGERLGHWLDKLKREWQMKQSFRHAVSIHKPDVVFFLGDLLDEGKWSNSQKFSEYANQFKNMFGDVNRAGEKPEIIVLSGNHDLGFHDYINPEIVDSFRREFKRSLIDEVYIKNHRFVLITSMALEGDGCRLCHEAEMRLKELRNEKAPIVLQHYPLYRKSDGECEKLDYLHEIDEEEIYRERWDTISKESTEKLIDWLNPRAVFDGHSHKMCKKRWTSKSPQDSSSKDYDFYEYTVNSFSWRNGDKPALLMVVINEENILVNSCRLPSEFVQFVIYFISGAIACIFLILSWCNCNLWPLRPTRKNSLPWCNNTGIKNE